VESAGLPLYQDVTKQSGVAFTCRNGEEANQYTILESLGAGVALFDYDNDGLLDIFLGGGGYFDGPDKTVINGGDCKLYRNLGNWKFQDVTLETGLAGPWFYNHGLAVADYDRDGFLDLLITGYKRLALFHNESAPHREGRRFTEVGAQSGLADDQWCTGAGWGDLDGDGYPEVYVCRYLDWSFENNPICTGYAAGSDRDVCPPQRFKPLVHALFANESDGNGGRRYRDEAAKYDFQALGCGLGVVLADLNEDGRPDIYVANDATSNFLFFNRGGSLEEKGLIAGPAVDDQGQVDGSMGIDVGDYDGSGRPALWVTNFQGDLHGLYANLGNEVFDHQTRPAGIAAVGLHLVAFGTGFVDVDNDGWEDLVFVNGHVVRRPALGSTFKQRPVLLKNTERKGRRFFTDISGQGGDFFSTPALGRGLAIGDLDNDGWADLVVSNINSPAVILRNVAGKAASPANLWLGIKLVGRDHRDTVGSTVTVEIGNRTLTRFAKGGGSYLSANDQRMLFGLERYGGTCDVKVRWSWGGTQQWKGLKPGSYWELREGEMDAVAVTYSPPRRETGED
jgi:hypothetical protein